MRKAVVILAGWLLVACGPGAPDIEVAAAYDMGSVAKGHVAVAEIPVRNVGDGPLTVAAVSTSCGCTKATLTPMTIPAAGEAVLRIEYDSGVHEADIGVIERYVFISSDDPDEDDVQIKFSVVVEPASSLSSHSTRHVGPTPPEREPCRTVRQARARQRRSNAQTKCREIIDFPASLTGRLHVWETWVPLEAGASARDQECCNAAP